MSIVLNGTGGTISGVPGQVLQVVAGTTNTNVSCTTSWVDTGLSASITPYSSTSKILVLVTQSCQAYRAAGAAYGGIQLLRGATTIWSPNYDSNGPYQMGWDSNVSMTSLTVYGLVNFSYLDSPATTSSTTYKTQQRAYGSGHQFYTQVSASVNGTSTITLMEIAA